jgi:hypothetical protein
MAARGHASGINAIKLQWNLGAWLYCLCRAAGSGAAGHTDGEVEQAKVVTEGHAVAVPRLNHEHARLIRHQLQT